MRARKNKKGISEVVASVLIILLTVAAVAVLVSFLRPFVINNLNKSSECIPYKDYYSFEQKIDDKEFNCYQNYSGQTLIGSSITSASAPTNGKEDNLAGFVLAYSNGIGGESVNLTDQKEITNSRGGIWVFGDRDAGQLQINAARETQTYVYNSSAVYTSVDIYPLLKSGRLCDKSDSITISQCKGVNLQ